MKGAGHWIIDNLYLAKAQSRAFLHRHPPKHYLDYVIPGKSPVILLPGIFEKWGFLKNLGDDLSKKGHQVFIVPKLGYHLKKVVDSAKIVRGLINENNLHNVILIGHSKGGLVGKYLLIYLNSDKRIKGLIAIATPFSGTSVAQAIPHSSLRELTPNSKLISELKTQSKVNSQIISIFPLSDNQIRSDKGSRLEGAKNIQIEAHGHHKILFTKQLIDQVTKSIGTLSKD